MTFEVIFNGIGTQIIYCLVSAVVGGYIGYKVGIKNRVVQRQYAKNNANQVQIGNVIKNGNSKSR